MGQLASPPRFYLLALLALPLLCAAGPAGLEDLPRGLDLGACIQIALERQPALAAYRSSLTAAEIGAESLQKLRAPTWLVRDLPMRRQQACLGVVAARAKVAQAEAETVYAVTRTYLSVLYARQQHAMLEEAVATLRERKADAEKAVKEGLRRNLTVRTVQQIGIYEQIAQARRDEAQQGVYRALAALREAMGVGPDFCLEIAADRLPEPAAAVELHVILELALARRGEIVQACSGVEITALEVKAQAVKCRTKVATFASGSDLHANPIPTGSSDGDYRPGAIGLEMPPTLVGSKCARVERARAYQARAEAVLEKVRNLVTLEVEDACYRWQEYREKRAQLGTAARDAAKLAEALAGDAEAGRAPYDDALNARVLATQLGAQATEALFNYDLALTALERITAGGFCAGFAVAVPK